MATMRVSCTQLESYRLFMQPDQEWMTEQDLVDSLTGKFVPTHQVQLGKAFGMVLEDPDRYRVDGGYEANGYSLSNDVMEPALALVDRRCVFEAKAMRQYGECLVVSRSDALLGTTLFEFKTTLASFDASKYMDSYQWRFMADMLQPSQIVYRVFCLFEPAHGELELRSIETLPLYPYAAVHEDCCALVDQFVHFVKLCGLDGFLRERQRAADAA
jgi:hypothetical protein